MFYRENKNSAIDQALKSLEESQRAAHRVDGESKNHSSFLLKDLLTSQILEPMGQSEEQIQTVIKESQQVFKSLSVKMKREIEKDPWAFLAKVAIGTFGLGMVLGHHSPLRRRKKDE